MSVFSSVTELYPNTSSGVYNNREFYLINYNGFIDYIVINYSVINYSVIDYIVIIHNINTVCVDYNFIAGNDNNIESVIKNLETNS